MVRGETAPPPTDPRHHDYAGIIHIHTTYSDGTGTYAQIARIAARRGLDFLIVTDHNTLQALADGKEGWYPTEAAHRTLVLVGEEISAPDGHVLAIGVTQPVRRDQPTQAILDDIARQGGLAFIAHPRYRRRPWTNWDVHGYAGLELYNVVEDVADAHWLRTGFAGLLAAPEAFYRALMRRPNATLAQWDRLLADGRPLVGLGAVDAHGLRLWQLRLAPYDVLFNTIRTHLLMSELSRGAVLEALRAGHAYLAVDLLGDATGFVVRAESEGRIAGVMGDAVPWSRDLSLRIYAPTTARLRLYQDGRLVEERRAQTWRYAVTAPGVYRVEADLHGQFWIAANPIYVQAVAEGSAP